MMCSPCDVRHSVSELVDVEVVVDVIIDAQAYRLLAQQAIQALHDLTVDHDRLRRAHYRLLDEYRNLRVRVARDIESAA